MAHGAVEITLALHAAIVLPGCILQLDAYPSSGSEVRVADVADGGVAAIAEPDYLADCKIRHGSLGASYRSLAISEWARLWVGDVDIDLWKAPLMASKSGFGAFPLSDIRRE